MSFVAKRLGLERDRLELQRLLLRKNANTRSNMLAMSGNCTGGITDVVACRLKC